MSDYHIFGTPNDISIEIDNLPFITCFRNRNGFQNGLASTLLSKMILKIFFFCQEAQNFVHFGQDDLVQI